MATATQYRFEACTVTTTSGATREVPAGIYPVVELSAVEVLLGPGGSVQLSLAEFSRLKLERLAVRV